MNDKQVLVTGGCGFIGSNLANTLVPRNEVHVIDNGYLGTPENLDERVHIHERDVLEDDLPTDVDVVFHLAALSSYDMHENTPCLGARVNIEGFVNVVEQARIDGCETIVYASTSSIYGNRTEPTPETVEYSANTGYEASKLARERYAEYFSTHHGLSLAGLRLFSVYQGYQGMEAHKGSFANIISQFADDIANDRVPEIYGDGTHSRDFIHVDDVVRGMELCADNQLDGVFNLGTGEHHTFNTVVERINNELGTTVAPTYVDNPIPSEVYVEHTCADTSRINAATGWTPTIDFDTGIERVCAPYQSLRPQ